LGQPLIVELVGLPGAGKSTIAAETLNCLRRAGHRVRAREELAAATSRGTRALRLVGSWARHPALLTGALAIASGGGSLGASRFRHAIKLAAWAPRLAGMAGDQTVLLDQGMVQQAWSALLRAPKRTAQVDALLQAVVRRAGARLVFVYCDLPAELAASRIAGRDTALSSFDRMPAAAARRMLAEEEASLRALFQRAVQVPGARQMVVDASRPVSENAALIAAVVEAG
jgi:thymidylate kinase